jgi:hypothetical protein
MYGLKPVPFKLKPVPFKLSHHLSPYSIYTHLCIGYTFGNTTLSWSGAWKQ